MSVLHQTSPRHSSRFRPRSSVYGTIKLRSFSFCSVSLLFGKHVKVQHLLRAGLNELVHSVLSFPRVLFRLLVPVSRGVHHKGGLNRRIVLARGIGCAIGLCVIVISDS